MEQQLANHESWDRIIAHPSHKPSWRYSDESNGLFFLIYNDLFNVSNGDKKEDELREIFARGSMRNVDRYGFIKDMIAVIGSDAARRQNYMGLAYYLVD